MIPTQNCHSRGGNLKIRRKFENKKHTYPQVIHAQYFQAIPADGEEFTQYAVNFGVNDHTYIWKITPQQRRHGMEAWRKELAVGFGAKKKRERTAPFSRSELQTTGLG
jgi:hypothetical protein